jgi:uncharacterized protein
LTTFYLDTSAVAKRYLTETGTTWVRALTTPDSQNTIAVCDFTPIEFFSLIARRQRERSLSLTDAETVKTRFLFHMDHEYISAPLQASVLTNAREFVGKHLLRPPDALQLACALYIVQELGEPIQFICADQNLLTAAQAEGLTTDNPNLHP